MKKILLLTCIISSLHCVAQNVGIGTPSPSEKLEVAGNVKANSFKYVTPKVLYYAIPDGAFTARTSSEIVQKTSGAGGAYITNGGFYGFVVPVYLPHKSKLISMDVDFYDASITQDVACYFVSQYNSGFVFEVTVTSTGSGGLNSQSAIVSPSLLINNGINAYEIIVAPTTGSWTGSDLQIRRIILGYTLDEAQ